MVSKRKEPSKAKPIFWDEKSDAVAILIHGFSGAPEELSELAKFLAKGGISVKLPVLAGHGDHWKTLADANAEDWKLSVERELDWARANFKKIFLVGFSLGGILALDAAARNSYKIAGVVSLSAPVFLRGEMFISVLLPIWHKIFKKYRKQFVAKEFLDAYEESGRYLYLPTKSIYDFYNFVKESRGMYKKVIVPTLVIQSQNDTLIHHLSAEYIFQELSSAQKELVIFDDTTHNQSKGSIYRTKQFVKISQFINEFL